MVACEMFGACIRAELHRAGTSPETRNQLVILFDNALICYGQKKRGDATTESVLQQLRPKVRQWLS